MNKYKHLKSYSMTAIVAALVSLVVITGIYLLYGRSAPPTSLVIKEWALRLPLTPSISDAYYTFDTYGDLYLSTRRLDALVGRIHGCTSGLHGLYYKKDPANQKMQEDQLIIEPACVVSANDQTNQIGTIQGDLRAAAQAAIAK